MPIADTKKVQTMINILAEAAEEARAAVAKMKAVRTKFQTTTRRWPERCWKVTWRLSTAP